VGYDAHITRSDDWSDVRGREITPDEWLAVVAADPELDLDERNGPYFAVWRGGPEPGAGWLDWSGGRVYAKNPDPALVTKMVALADALHATVQGDDGEIYGGETGDRTVAGAPPPRGIVARVRALFASVLQRPRGSEAATARLPFGPGDRVRDAWGNEGIVVSIDLDADMGLGAISIRYGDGRVATVAAVAHELERLD
jgi:hypothetical protein